MNAPVLFRSKWERTLGKTESPIESMFLAAFCEIAFEHGYCIAKTAARNDTIGVVPQKTVDRYTIDIAVSFGFHGQEIHVAVEADGHEFHERTPHQAKHDRRRDRALSDLGYQVRRFTGSEINADPGGCAGEILSLIEGFQTRVIERAMEAA